MNASQFIKVTVVSLVSLLLASDAGFGEENWRQKQSLFTPFTADFGEDHLHLAVLQTEKNLFDSDDKAFCQVGFALYERYNLRQSEDSPVIFDAALVPRIEIGRKYKNHMMTKVGFYGKAGFLTFKPWFDGGVVFRAGPTQFKMGNFRGILTNTSYYGMGDPITTSKPAAVSYITVGLSPTFSF